MEIGSAQSVAAYLRNREATQPGEGRIGEEFTGIARDFAQTLQEGERVAMEAMTSGDADPHALVQALAQTELAVETAVTIRNRVVEAYQEILRMPV